MLNAKSALLYQLESSKFDKELFEKALNLGEIKIRTCLIPRKEIEGVEQEFKHGYSTSLGRLRIISAAEEARNNDYFVKQWVVFAVLSAVPTFAINLAS